jgi:UDP-N-acetylglucosamine 2-epimerase (non-hydrolysing)
MGDIETQQPHVVTVLHVVGARPNYMKISPAVLAAEAWNRAAASDVTGLTEVADSGRQASVRFAQKLVHTGQHYDRELCEMLFDDLGLREPDYMLGIGAATPIVQVARVMESLETVLLALHPDVALVPGDVNSSMAAAVACVKLGIPVAHVEAGVRSFDREMPEENNRVVIDHLADVLYAPSQEAVENLLREGIPAERIALVGNTMVDTLDRLLPAAMAREIPVRESVGLGRSEPFVLATLHRPSNVDDSRQLGLMLTAFEKIAARVPVVFPVHPRTLGRLRESGLEGEYSQSLHVVPPLGYLDFVALMRSASAVMTDSGGVQAETSRLGVPCVTLRTTTEWRVTLDTGTAVLVNPDDVDAIAVATLTRALRADQRAMPAHIDLWDGAAAGRLVRDLATRFAH